MTDVLLFVFILVGVLLYALVENQKLTEAGRLMFGCALLAVCMGASPKGVNLVLLLISVMGLLLYALSNGKLSEIGRLIYACALLAICMGAAGPHLPRIR